jgi:hypothetical protein
VANELPREIMESMGQAKYVSSAQGIIDAVRAS